MSITLGYKLDSLFGTWNEFGYTEICGSTESKQTITKCAIKDSLLDSLTITNFYLC